MNFKLYVLTAAFALASTVQAQTTPFNQMEKLTRGLVVVPTASGSGRFISWRLFGTDNDLTSFDVLRNGTVVAKNISIKTNYIDLSGVASSSYQVVTKQNGVATDTTPAVTSWSYLYKQIPLDRPAGGITPVNEKYTYSPNDCSVGDVDGDGDYEIILKWDPSNAKDNSQSGYTGNVYLDCYEMDGTKLWRIDLGKNCRAGAHYTQFMVYDFDGDGKAEMICKTATGSMDSEGNFVNTVADDASIKSADNLKDWRNSSGKVTGGQEYLTVFEGLTGKAINTIFYNPNRATTYGGAPGWTFNWDDRSGKTDKEYGNRGERYLACAAYLDGQDKNPSAVFSRGYYTNAFVWAVDFDGQKLKQKWLHASKSRNTVVVTDANGKSTTKTYTTNTAKTTGSCTAYSNGNHNLSVADVDGDGCDEIIWGSCAINNDGHLLYATGYGHGDAIHLGDFVPDHPGLELFQVHEASPYGWDLHDAATGKILLSATTNSDNGRGLAADIDATNRGAEFCSAGDRSIRSAVTGAALNTGSTSVNFRTYWDGDLQEELLDGNKMDKWNGNGTTRIYPIKGKNFYSIESSSSCNGSKSTPNIQADILGDWREEVVLWDGSDSAHLNVFTTNLESNFRVPTLMHDHVYRMGVIWQNTAYNQPPHLGYYLPDSFYSRFVTTTEGQTHQTVNLGDSIIPIHLKWVNCGNPSMLKSMTPDGTEILGNAVDGFTFTRDISSNKLLTLEGKPTLTGEYTFILKSGSNVIDQSIINDTIRICCIDSSLNHQQAITTQRQWLTLSSSVISDALSLQLNLDKAQPINVTIYSVAGAQVFAQSYYIDDNASLSISGLGHLSEGIYIVNVKSSEATISKKIIKK